MGRVDWCWLQFHSRLFHFFTLFSEEKLAPPLISTMKLKATCLLVAVLALPLATVTATDNPVQLEEQDGGHGHGQGG